MGVDIFFVISGFLITSILLSELDVHHFSIITFYGRRIRRIFPALTVVMIFCLIFGWFALLPIEFKQLGKHVAGGAAFISNIVLWNESGYFDSSAEFKPLLHLWSLGVEEQFYIVWPLILWTAYRARSNLLLIIITIATGSFILNISTVVTHPVATFYLPLTRFWELLCGAILAQASINQPVWFTKLRNGIDRRLWPLPSSLNRSPPATALRTIQSIFGGLLIGFAVIIIQKDWSFPGWWALLPTIGTTLIIGSGQSALLNRIIANRITVGIGLISYPLYLWHWPMLAFARIVEGETPTYHIRLVALSAALMLSIFTFQFIEKPVKYAPRQRILTLGLLALMASVGMTGYYIFLKDGLTDRSSMVAISENRFDFPYRQTCERISGEPEEYGQDWCNLPSEIEARSISTIVIGDSFSNAYSTAFSDYFKRNDQPSSFIQVGRALCPFLLNFGPPYCRNITEKTYRYVLNHENIKTVVIAANWPFYFDLGGKSWPNIFHIEGNDKFRAAFTNTVEAYRSAGKKVIVLLSPPGGVNPRACVLRPIRFTDKNICNLPLTQARVNDGTYRSEFLPILQSLGIPYFDPFQILCDDLECKVIDGTKIFYEDAQHISVFGGKYLSEKGDSIFAQLLK